MKRRFLIGLTVILCLTLMVTSVTAAGGTAALGTAAGVPGSTVYLTLSISGFEDADSFAIVVGGDLSLNTAQCQWTREDTKIQSFDGNRGVWATDTAKDLNGSLAKLAFTVPQLEEDQTDMDYEVTCTVLVKNDAQTLGTVTATGTVSVTNPATGMVLYPATLTLKMGSKETADLTVTVEPANTSDQVVWTSSDATVASVSDGKVTAHKPGSAVITATAGAVSKTCTVTVECDHSYIWKTDKEATESDTGLKHEECTVCGAKRNENTVIDKLPHVHTGITKHDAVAATCAAKGNVEYWTCSGSLCAGKYYGDDKCQQELTDITTPVDAQNHTGGTEVKKAAKETCGKDGYTGDTHCLGCGEKLKSGKKIAATGKHAYTDDKDESCNTCGFKREVSVKIETTPMYRLYNPNSGEHFYTGSVEEREMLVAAGWAYEGVAWNAPIYTGDPVYRVYNPNSGDHHYTMSWEEVQNLVAIGWIYEGVAWNSASVENIPQYRLYNPNADVGSHHYTSSTVERDFLVSLGWILEGIGWFGMLY